MMEHLLLILGVTLTIIQCLDKWKFFAWYAAHYGHIGWLPDAECMLCVGFWLANIAAIIYSVLLHFNIQYILIPFACAGFINYLQITLKK